MERLASRALQGTRIFVADFTPNGEFVQLARDEFVADSFAFGRSVIADGLPAHELIDLARVAAEGGADLVVLYKVPGSTTVEHLVRVHAPRVLCEVAR